MGQWAAVERPGGPAEESTFRRAFALVGADSLDQVLGSWLHTRAARADGRLVIAVDGKAVRGAKDKDGKAPHLVAAPARAAMTSSRSWSKVGQGFTRGIGGRQERPNLSDLRGDETR